MNKNKKKTQSQPQLYINSLKRIDHQYRSNHRLITPTNGWHTWLMPARPAIRQTRPMRQDHVRFWGAKWRDQIPHASKHNKREGQRRRCAGHNNGLMNNNNASLVWWTDTQTAVKSFQIAELWALSSERVGGVTDHYYNAPNNGSIALGMTLAKQEIGTTTRRYHELVVGCKSYRSKRERHLRGWRPGPTNYTNFASLRIMIYVFDMFRDSV